jgi:BirA family biotin operon repressor/biotin-[acetyl-CoA-carboxylase] ligase
MIIGSKLFFFENLPSTNTYAIDLLKENMLPEGAIIQTNFQLAGRGYSSNKWESEDGKNLLISIVIYPTFINAEDQFSISMTISLGICDFLEQIIPVCAIKWPNDIYVLNDKIAGILIESSISGTKIEYSIAGIGLNINQMSFSKNIPNPTSLSLITGNNYNIQECLNMLACALDKRYKQLISGDTSGIKNEYVSKLYRLNKWSEFKDEKGLFTGRINSINEEGRLVVERTNGNKTDYAFKEVEFIL